MVQINHNTNHNKAFLGADIYLFVYYMKIKMLRNLDRTATIARRNKELERSSSVEAKKVSYKSGDSAFIQLPGHYIRPDK